jgi:hypothetical protein
VNEVDAVLAGNKNAVERMASNAPLLAAWFEHEIGELHKTCPTEHGGLLMGTPVWGAEYVERMCTYSLPCLGAPKNLEALSGKAVIVFYGVRADRGALFKATRWLRQVGIHTLFRDIPKELIDNIGHPEDKYGILSVVQNVIAHMAGHNGMAMHMYCADHAYADGYFHSLARLGAKHPAIIQQGMSANIDTLADDLEKFRDPDTGALAVPAETLGGLTLKHIHARTGKTIANGLKFPDEWPSSHQVSWIGKDAVHMAATPQNVAYLCPELCMDAPVAFTSTLDMLPPEYIPPGQWYMAGRDDGMVFCELSGEKLVPPFIKGSLDQFILRHWQQVSFVDDYTPYFAQRCLTPIPERAEGEYMPDAEIEAQHAYILEHTAKGKPWAMDTYYRSQVPLRW